MKTMRQENCNSATQTYRSIWWIVLAIAFTVAGCGVAKPKTPPKQQVQDAVAAVLPPFLSLDSIELEPISTGPEAVKINFKAIVAPKEDLYQVDREVEGTPRVTLLKMVQTAGTKVSLYGFVEANRTIDRWTLGPPQIQIDPTQFGNPKGSFHAQSYVTDSREAIAALKQQTLNAELQAQAKKAAVEQQERERIAREEQEARQEEARKNREEQARVAREKAAAPAELAEIEERIAQTERDLSTCQRVAREATLTGEKRQAESDAASDERTIARLKARKAELTNLLRN